MILAVVVKPDPPWEAAVMEAEGGMGRARTMEGSSFIFGKKERLEWWRRVGLMFVLAENRGEILWRNEI